MTRKKALVTGAGRGIGEAIARTLGNHSYDVGVHYHSSEDGARAVRDAIRATGGRAEVIQADLRQLADIERLFETFLVAFDTIDLLVNNAGVTRTRRFVEVDETFFNDVIATDLRGPYFCAQTAARAMINANTQGVIVNITSNQQDGCWPRASVYGPAKAALLKFTRHAAMELGPNGIRVVAVAPGYTPSHVSRVQGERPSSGLAARIPLGTYARREEIAEAVVYLASDAAAYITGTCLTIDGGALLPVLPENDYV
ncbi:MAG: SDR family oxidoreductase [Lentisphaerae bacterium]|nr:SDR family oxidoreductase [Lentisphaerota bacterium]